MNYTTIYEAQRSYGGISPAFIFLCLFSFIIIVYIICEWKKVSIGTKIMMSLIIIFLGIVFFSVFSNHFSSLDLVYDQYVKGKGIIVEGVIGNYEEHPDHPPSDTFYVNNKLFYLPGFTTIWGYPLRERDGGVLKNGLHVRITYVSYKCENVMMKLEIIDQ